MAKSDDLTEHGDDDFGASSYSPLLNDLYRTNDEELYRVVEVHLRNGQDPNRASAYGETPLGQAFSRGRMDVFALLLENGADISVMGWDPIHEAVALGSVEDVEAMIPAGDMLARTGSGLTPFLLACDIGDIEKAAILLPVTPKSGRYRTYHRQPALIVATEKGRAGIVTWLIANGFDVNEADEFGGTALISAAQQDEPEIVEILLQAGADIDAKYDLTASVNAIRQGKPDLLDNLKISEYLDDVASYQTAVSETESARVARLLIDAGAEPGDFSGEVLRALTGADLIPQHPISAAVFDAQKHRVFGSRNPEEVDHAFWREMVRTGMPAYAAYDEFGTGDRDFSGPAIWSFDRFGMSTTPLPDGRWVQVAGEHEDSYDVDFLIYNHVFVHDGSGGLRIFTYPESVFPPTDFHTATLAGDTIILIGNLGYPQDRVVGQTQVLRLDLQTFAIERIETTGEAPGWINGHREQLAEGRIIISGGVVWDGSNLKPIDGAYSLSLESFAWTKLT